MATKFYDKNGTELHIGDIVRPDKGRDCRILNINYVEDMEEECMIAQQVLDPLAFSPLTVDNLAKQFTKISENGITKEE